MDALTKSLLGDMRPFAMDAMDILGVRNEAEVAASKTIRHALIRAIEVVGEAASQIPLEYRQSHPEIDWRSVIGMRNRLVHGYAFIRVDILVSTVTDDLPPPISTLDSIIKETPE
jgi:uncharacterized protein with HEPN domain